MKNTKPLYYDNEGERIKHQESLKIKENTINIVEDDQDDQDIVILNDEYFPAFDDLDEGYPV